MTIKRTISGMIGAGSLAHNRRDFIAENVDSDRVHLNICYQNENLKEVYKELLLLPVVSAVNITTALKKENSH